MSSHDIFISDPLTAGRNPRLNKRALRGTERMIKKKYSLAHARRNTRLGCFGNPLSGRRCACVIVWRALWQVDLLDLLILRYSVAESTHASPSRPGGIHGRPPATSAGRAFHSIPSARGVPAVTGWARTLPHCVPRPGIWVAWGTAPWARRPAAVPVTFAQRSS
ncbi:hypothetical protein EVAR_72550_1 [Eumeta japonica]|uniref:Uncharacterized protein n=1 Tax=Eumeta variegata TaxID=151549 RepID=A0A4C1SBU6_EUMVA|nr:hypothetical protein EVAR_72550_1 [Eumeta japonica]